MTVNTLESMSVIPSGKALAAEIRGVDFAKPVPDDVRDAIVAAWAEHLVLLFRGLALDDDQLLQATEYFGGQQAAGSRDYFVKAGYKPGQTGALATRPGISIITNIGDDGELLQSGKEFGNLPLKWHSDNSYVEVPPTGSLLHAHVVPVNGGGVTSFNNQYLAYETLPDDLKAAIEGKHVRHDDHTDAVEPVETLGEGLVEPQAAGVDHVRVLEGQTGGLGQGVLGEANSVAQPGEHPHRVPGSKGRRVGRAQRPVRPAPPDRGLLLIGGERRQLIDRRLVI